MYKKITDAKGLAQEFTPPSSADLIRWVQNVLTKLDKKISPAAAQSLIRTAPNDMTTLIEETKKLAAFASTADEITASHIDAIITPSLQARVFDMVAAMANGSTAEAITLYRKMLHLKEEPFMILGMVIRQFRILLQCKSGQAAGMSRATLAETTGLRSFIVDEALSQCRRFTEEKLLQALLDCQKTDMAIKSGTLGPSETAAELGVELLIIKHSA